MARKYQIANASFLIIGLSFFNIAFADSWTASSDVKAASISYQGDTTRKNLTDYGINLQTNYLDRLDMMLGYSQLKLNVSQGGNVRQNQVVIGGNWFQYVDSISGRIGWHIKGYSLTSPSSTIANVYTGGWSYLNYRKTIYLDTLFTQSQYTNSQSSDNQSSDNTVNQLNLSFEFSPGLKSSWLSFQVFSVDNTDDVLFDSTLYSAIVEWTQNLWRSGSLIPTKLIFGTQFGDQRYLVLHRLDAINNNPDIQTLSYWANATWQINDHSELGLSIAASDYQTDQQANYDGIYTSLLLKLKW